MKHNGIQTQLTTQKQRFTSWPAKVNRILLWSLNEDDKQTLLLLDKAAIVYTYTLAHATSEIHRKRRWTK